jgi:creatinine amidohydrolase/Fe(II)-dependent formamide hydrolase-like protein
MSKRRRAPRHGFRRFLILNSHGGNAVVSRFIADRIHETADRGGAGEAAACSGRAGANGSGTSTGTAASARPLASTTPSLVNPRPRSRRSPPCPTTSKR